jgi:uncharacterized membrane protein
MGHDYVILGIVCMFLVTNFLGLAFTIRRLRSQTSTREAGAKN